MLNRQQRRRAILSAGHGRDGLRYVAWLRKERLAGREHCVTADFAPFLELPELRTR